MLGEEGEQGKDKKKRPRKCGREKCAFRASSSAIPSASMIWIRFKGYVLSS